MKDVETGVLTAALEEVVLALKAAGEDSDRVEQAVLFATHEQLKRIRSSFYSLFVERRVFERREARTKREMLKFQEAVANAKEFLAKDAAIRNMKQGD
jgi:hypothetical protein